MLTPVSLTAATYANSILESLPDNVIPPEITPEDGRIAILEKIGFFQYQWEKTLFAAIVGLRKFHGQTELNYRKRFVRFFQGISLAIRDK